MAIEIRTTRPLRGAALLLALLLCAGPAAAQSESLIANPMGPVTIEIPAQAMPQQGPEVELPAASDQPIAGSQGLDVAEALAIESNATVAEQTLNGDANKPLGGAGDARLTGTAGESDTASNDDATGVGWGLRTALALLFVITLILFCKAVFLKLAGRSGSSIAAQLGPSGRAPSGLLSVLARYPVSKGTSLVLLRLDRRVLLLSQTGQGFSTLAEIDDPEEVAALLMRAEDEEGSSLTRRFRSLLSQAESDPGLVGERDYRIEPIAAMTPRAANARFQELAMDEAGEDAELSDAVGSLRDRLRSLREVTA